MPRALRLYIVGVVGTSAVALVATALLFPVDSSIALRIPGLDSANQTWAGLAFWTLITLAAWALPVRLGRGSTVAVSIAPILAALSLGGPAAGGIVALLGTTEMRELRGRIPWYGSLANHAAIVLPAVTGGVIARLIGGPPANLLLHPELNFAGLIVGSVVYIVGNIGMATGLLAVRTNQPFESLMLANLREFAPNQLGLAPLGWLMAYLYGPVPWADFLLAAPLSTTRLAYLRLVEMREMFTQTISSLAQAVDKRDKFTSGHSLRVKEIAVDIGREMRVGERDMEALEWGGLLHDVGKIGVPDSVLLKQDRLTKDERTIMNAHPVLGAEIIAPVSKLAPELPIIRHHHEWYNGSGYPDRLMGDEIPRLARILHVADAFEAMTAARPYRMKPLTAAEALGELRKFSGVQFDPVVIDAFVKTRWVAGVPDPGQLPPPREVPLIGHAAARMAQATTRSEASASAHPPAVVRDL